MTLVVRVNNGAPSCFSISPIRRLTNALRVSKDFAAFEKLPNFATAMNSSKSLIFNMATYTAKAVGNKSILMGFLVLMALNISTINRHINRTDSPQK